MKVDLEENNNNITDIACEKIRARTQRELSLGIVKCWGHLLQSMGNMAVCGLEQHGLLKDTMTCYDDKRRQFSTMINESLKNSMGQVW